jgi:hypothetical protein
MIVQPGETIGQRLAQTQTDHTLSENEIICLAPVNKSIGAECRCWVVGDEVVGVSFYKRDGVAHAVVPHENVQKTTRKVVAAIHERFRPADAYVIDLADTDEGLLVVEYNCINCSGRYEVDRGHLFQKILTLSRVEP